MFCPPVTDDFMFDENLVKITDYKVLGKLPDPFIMEDGTKVDSKEKWQERRKEIYKTAVELQYGTLPPKPEVFKVETTRDDVYSGTSSYRITAGTKEKQVSFMMHVTRPSKKFEPFPAVITGDVGFMYAHMDTELYKAFTSNGISFVTFDRTELANDIKGEGRRKGPLYDVYPEYTFGAVGAWAWGYSRCVDALEILGIEDMNLIAFTGHSRGAKTAMLAGVCDERAAIVNPNSTCAGSCSCYRIHTKAIAEDERERRSETLEDMIEHFPFWFGEGMADYVNRAEELPFDSHYLKALVAPRVLLDTEAASDTWACPVGSYMTTQAAKEVYKFLGKEENIYWSFRKGFHRHKLADAEMLINIISHIRDGAPISDRFSRLPFKKPEPIYDWRAPEAK